MVVAEVEGYDENASLGCTEYRVAASVDGHEASKSKHRFSEFVALHEALRPHLAAKGVSGAFPVPRRLRKGSQRVKAERVTRLAAYLNSLLGTFSDELPGCLEAFLAIPETKSTPPEAYPVKARPSPMVSEPPLPRATVEGLTKLGLSSEPRIPSAGLYEHSSAVDEKLEQFDLLPAARQMVAEGYTVVRDCFSAEECAAIAKACKANSNVSRLTVATGVAAAPEVLSAITHEKVLALVRFCCGDEASLATISASFYGPAGTGFQPRQVKAWGMHADNDKSYGAFPKAPVFRNGAFPNLNMMLTCCVILNPDGYSEQTGATRVVPGSHRLGRAPDKAALAACEGLTMPMEARQGDVVCWDGGVWHAFGVRAIPGERQVLHVTYNRPSSIPAFEDFESMVDTASLEGLPRRAELLKLLRRGEDGAPMEANPMIKEIKNAEAYYKMPTWMFRPLMKMAASGYFSIGSGK